MKRLGYYLRLVGRAILETVFPVDCLGCGRPGFYICPDCLAGIGRERKSVCSRCSRATRFGEYCEQCRERYGVAVDAIVAAASYDDRVVQEAIHLFKYQHVRGMAGPLGAILDWGLRRVSGIPGFDLERAMVVPVPVGRRRFLERGYNQSWLLCLEIGKRTGLVCRDVLEKRRRTKHQAGLGEAERLTNLRGTFGVKAGARRAVRGRQVIVVDDVSTTGSTLDECARALKAAGAEKVFGLVVAKGG